MALVEEELPGVAKVRSDFQVREDSALAVQLQEQEFEEHFNSNVQSRRTARVDVGMAKGLQKDEISVYRQQEHQRRVELREREDADRRAAEQVSAKLKEEEEIQAALKMQDEIMAKKLHEEEMKSITQRRRQEVQDARLARQASLQEEEETRQRRVSEQELSEREIRRMRELELQGQKGQQQRSKYGPREPRQGSGSPPHQRREVAAQETRAESSPTQQTRASKYAPRTHSPPHSPPPPPQQSPPPHHQPPPSQSTAVSSPPPYPGTPDPSGPFSGFEEPAPMDENERIALQEQEDERLAREMIEREEQTAAAERRRREQEDLEVARKLQEQEMEARRRRRQQEEAIKRQTDVAKQQQQQEQQQQLRQPSQQPSQQPQQQAARQQQQPSQQLPQAARQQQQQPHRQAPQQPQQQQQATRQQHPPGPAAPQDPRPTQSLPPRQYNRQGSSGSGSGEERRSSREQLPAALRQQAPTQSVPASLPSHAQLPPEGHPFNPGLAYRPAMTGIQVPKATLTSADHPSSKSYKRQADTKKGKKKK